MATKAEREAAAAAKAAEEAKAAELAMLEAFKADGKRGRKASPLGEEVFDVKWNLTDGAGFVVGKVEQVDGKAVKVTRNIISTWANKRGYDVTIQNGNGDANWCVTPKKVTA